MATSNDKLTLKQAEFLRLMSTPGLPTYGNATESYRQSYDVANMSEQVIRQEAHYLTQHPNISIILKQIKDLAVQSVTMDRLEVLRQLADIANADPTKVTHTRRLCCRHCHGVGHNYQWRDPTEYWEKVAEVMDYNARRAMALEQDENDKRWRDTSEKVLPNDMGGYGWRRPNKPHPDCPRCFGEGEADVWIADMTTLTGPERRLIAGVKQTKEGLEVKMRDQDGSLRTIAQILKMLVNTVEASGPDGGPIQVAALAAVLPVDPVLAAQAYQQMMEGKTPK